MGMKCVRKIGAKFVNVTYETQKQKYSIGATSVALLFILNGEDLHLKPGHYFKIYGTVFQILGKSNLSRPVCDSCKKPCQRNIFTRENIIVCSRRSAYDVV